MKKEIKKADTYSNGGAVDGGAVNDFMIILVWLKIVLTHVAIQNAYQEDFLLISLKGPLISTGNIGAIKPLEIIFPN